MGPQLNYCQIQHAHQNKLQFHNKNKTWVSCLYVKCASDSKYVEASTELIFPLSSLGSAKMYMLQTAAKWDGTGVQTVCALMWRQRRNVAVYLSWIEWSLSALSNHLHPSLLIAFIKPGPVCTCPHRLEPTLALNPPSNTLNTILHENYH